MTARAASREYVIASPVRVPLLVQVAHHGNLFVRRFDARWNLQVLRVRQGQSGVKHADLRPLDQSPPHLPDENERHIFDMPDLEKLPDHQRLKNGADAAWHNDKRIGGDHEVMQAREERLVLEGLLDERIHLLLERQLDTDAD